MSRSYDEVVELLKERSDHEVAVQVAQVEQTDGTVACLGVVTLDGVTRGVISKDGMLASLEKAAQRVLLGDDASPMQILRNAIEEFGFDAAVALVERDR